MNVRRERGLEWVIWIDHKLPGENDQREKVIFWLTVHSGVLNLAKNHDAIKSWAGTLGFGHFTESVDQWKGNQISGGWEIRC